MSRTGKGAPPSRRPLSLFTGPKLDQAWALQQQGRFADAERLYDEVLRFEPSHPAALTMLGSVCLQTGRTERGVSLLRKALEMDAKSPQAHFYLGNGLKDLGRDEDALASFDRSIALRPNIADSHFARGTTLYFLGRYEAALASFDKAIALRPDFALAYNNRGIALADLKTLQGGRSASFNKAIALKRDYAQAYSNRGFALNALGQFKEALESFDRAVALAPDFRPPITVAASRSTNSPVWKKRWRASSGQSPSIRKMRRPTIHMASALNVNGRRVEAIAAVSTRVSDKARLCGGKAGRLHGAAADPLCRRGGDCGATRGLSRSAGSLPRGGSKGRSRSSDLAAALGSSQPFLLAYQGFNDRDLQSIYGLARVPGHGRATSSREAARAPAAGRAHKAWHRQRLLPAPFQLENSDQGLAQSDRPSEVSAFRLPHVAPRRTTRPGRRRRFAIASFRARLPSMRGGRLSSRMRSTSSSIRKSAWTASRALSPRSASPECSAIRGGIRKPAACRRWTISSAAI